MLNDKQIKALQPTSKEYKKFDGKGLYILIHPNGSKYWRLKYRFGKEKLLPLGVYPDVSLADARARATKARQQIADNIDPAVAKRIAKAKATNTGDGSFKIVAAKWLEARRSMWTARYADYVWRRAADTAPLVL